MELISYYQTNINNIYNRIKDLYNEASPFFDNDVSLPDMEVMKLNNSKGSLNRAFYDWSLACIKQLQSVMNDVIGDFNDNGIVDEDAGDTALLKLWVPERLAVNDTYMTNLKNNFDMCNKLLDNLNSYTQEYMNY